MRAYRELQRGVSLSPPPTGAPLFATLRDADPDACPKTTTELASLIDYWCAQSDPELVTQLVRGWRAQQPERLGSKVLRDRNALDLRDEAETELPEL